MVARIQQGLGALARGTLTVAKYVVPTAVTAALAAIQHTPKFTGGGLFSSATPATPFDSIAIAVQNKVPASVVQAVQGARIAIVDAVTNNPRAAALVGGGLALTAFAVITVKYCCRKNEAPAQLPKTPEPEEHPEPKKLAPKGGVLAVKVGLENIQSETFGHQTLLVTPKKPEEEQPEDLVLPPANPQVVKPNPAPTGTTPAPAASGKAPPPPPPPPPAIKPQKDPLEEARRRKAENAGKAPEPAPAPRQAGPGDFAAQAQAKLEGGLKKAVPVVKPTTTTVNPNETPKQRAQREAAEATAKAEKEAAIAAATKARKDAAEAKRLANAAKPAVVVLPATTPKHLLKANPAIDNN